MRPIVILLLLGVFSVAGDLVPCAQRFKEISGKKVTFTKETNTLTCDDEDNALMAIEWKSNRHKSLLCDFEHGWSGKDEHSNEPIISVKCVEHCAVTGPVESELEKLRIKDHRFRFAKCPDGDRMFIDGKRYEPALIWCVWDGKWAHGDKHGPVITKDDATPLQVECVKPCSHGKGVDIVSDLVDNSKSTVFKCNKPSNPNEKYGVSVVGKTIVYSHLKCNKDVGFTDAANNVIEANAFADVNLECAVANPCTHEPSDSSEINFDSTTKTLTCAVKKDALMAIEFNSNRYKSLTCDEFDGWKNETNTVADAITKINVKCVEYCAATGDKTIITNTIDSGERIMSCYENPGKDKKSNEIKVDKYLLLSVNNAPISSPKKFAICNLNHGWNEWHSKNPRLLSIDTKNPALVECKKACEKITKVKGVISEEPEKDTDDTLIRFKCNKPEVNGEKYGIRNGSDFYKNLDCNLEGWYEDYYNSDLIAGPFEPAHLECALPPTTTTTTTMAPTTAQEKSPEKDDTDPSRPSKPTEDDDKKVTEKDETVSESPATSKPSENDDDHPQSTHSPISAFSLYLIVFILVRFGNS